MVITSECGGIGSLAVADALADHQAADQAGDAGIDVDDGAAGEVERAPLKQPASPVASGCFAAVLASVRLASFGGMEKSGPAQYQTMCAIGK